MITKEQILNNFTKEEASDVIRTYDMLMTAYNKEYCTFTSFFCSPNLWSYFIKGFNSKSFKVDAFGGFEDSDRRILSFGNMYDERYPIKYIKIENKSKFTTLTHRDYLGTIMSVGLERNKFGDLIVKDHYAVVPIMENMAEYLKEKLNYVKNCPVDISILEEPPIVGINYNDIVINIASLRLDNVVAQLANISRSKAVTMVENSSVLVDYVKANDKSMEIIKGQRITIHGKGKYIIGDILGNTKSGKFKINIKKYV